MRRRRRRIRSIKMVGGVGVGRFSPRFDSIDAKLNQNCLWMAILFFVTCDVLLRKHGFYHKLNIHPWRYAARGQAGGGRDGPRSADGTARSVPERLPERGRLPPVALRPPKSLAALVHRVPALITTPPLKPAMGAGFCPFLPARAGTDDLPDPWDTEFIFHGMASLVGKAPFAINTADGHPFRRVVMQTLGIRAGKHRPDMRRPAKKQSAWIWGWCHGSQGMAHDGGEGLHLHVLTALA